jgi:hypothetical protein
MKPRLRKKEAKPTTGRQRRIDEESNLVTRQASSQKSYSYSSRRSEEAFNVGRGATKNKQNKLASGTSYGVKRFGLIILGLAIIISFVKVVSLSSTATVHLAGVKENALIAKTGESVYSQAITKYLRSSIWNKNKITLDSTGLANYITTHYPEISSVDVSTPFVDNHLVVYLTSTQPAIILTEPKASYALDGNGRAILTAPTAAALNLNIPVITDQSGLSVSLGKLALSSSDIYFVKEVVGQLQAKSYKVSQMTLPANTDELDVSLTGEPYYIKFNLEASDPRQEAGTFLATIANLKSQNITPSKYIDVRVDGRAYYQ